MDSNPYLHVMLFLPLVHQYNQNSSWTNPWKSPFPTCSQMHTYIRKVINKFLHWILTNWRERMLNDSLVCYLYQANINLLKPGFSFPILLLHLLSHLTRSQSWEKFCCLQSLSNKYWIFQLKTGEWTWLFNFELSYFCLPILQLLNLSCVLTKGLCHKMVIIK